MFYYHFSMNSWAISSEKGYRNKNEIMGRREKYKDKDKGCIMGRKKIRRKLKFMLVK